MDPDPNKRKFKPPSRRTASLPAAKKPKDATPMSTSNVPAEKKTGDPASSSSPVVVEAQSVGADCKIQKAKSFAVAQAQQEGCMGNFRICDSSFGNFLIPAIPTRSELA